MECSVSIWLASRTRWVHLIKSVAFGSRPRVGEYLKLRNARFGDYFPWRVTEVTHREGGALEVWTELLDDVGGRGYSFEAEDEFDAYLEAYRAEGWVTPHGVTANRRVSIGASGAAAAREVSRGDLFWVEEISSRGEPISHPYLVLQEDFFNRSRLSTVVMCGLSSRLQLGAEMGNVLLDEGEGQLPRRSVIVVSQLMSFDRSRLGDKIGTLSEDRVGQALAGLMLQQLATRRAVDEQDAGDPG